MSVSSEFEDLIMTCEFYASSVDELYVDLENYHIRMDGYGIDPVTRDGHLVRYLVEAPDGKTLFVDDLDSYLQCVLPGWEDR